MREDVGVGKYLCHVVKFIINIINFLHIRQYIDENVLHMPQLKKIRKAMTMAYYVLMISAELQAYFICK